MYTKFIKVFLEHQFISLIGRQVPQFVSVPSLFQRLQRLYLNRSLAKITARLFCLLLLWSVKSFNVLKLSPHKQKLMAVIYLVFPLCWAAMLIQLTAVAALLPREGGTRRGVCVCVFKELGVLDWGSRIDRVSTNPAGTERRKPLRRPLECHKRSDGGRVNGDG